MKHFINQFYEGDERHWAILFQLFDYFEEKMIFLTFIY